MRASSARRYVSEGGDRGSSERDQAQLSQRLSEALSSESGTASCHSRTSLQCGNAPRRWKLERSTPRPGRYRAEAEVCNVHDEAARVHLLSMELFSSMNSMLSIAGRGRPRASPPCDEQGGHASARRLGLMIREGVLFCAAGAPCVPTKYLARMNTRNYTKDFNRGL